MTTMPEEHADCTVVMSSLHGGQPKSTNQHNWLWTKALPELKTVVIISRRAIRYAVGHQAGVGGNHILS